MHKIQTSDGTTLVYDDEGTGEPVVLVGGHASRRGSWALQRRALVDAGYRVVSVDRRHAGDSDFPDFGQRMSRQGADLLELQEQVGLQDAVWVGSSMGASALLARADLFGTFGVRALVLVDQTPRMVNDDEWSFGLYGLTWSEVEEFVRSFPGTLTPFHQPPPPHVLAALAGDVGEPYPHDLTRALVLDHTVQDWRDVVRRLDVPLLAVGGRHSPLWPVESSLWMGDAAPYGRAVVLEDSGHAPQLSEPERFSQTLLDFLAEL